jgi:ParB-like chromosome segregation protein Spo0J
LSWVVHEILNGIRAVPRTDIFSENTKIEDEYRSIGDIEKVKNLISQIKTNKWIKPLIIVVENEGPYVLEGGHRSVA